jgi:hypothetical protein
MDSDPTKPLLTSSEMNEDVPKGSPFKVEKKRTDSEMQITPELINYERSST